METSQISFNSARTEKGREGELRVATALTEHGFKVIHVGGAVKFSLDGPIFFCADLLVFGKDGTFWVQVKNKNPRRQYPDTGLEGWRFQKLWDLRNESKLLVLLLFTDDSGKIYGEWIGNLRENGDHGNVWNSETSERMVYFWLKDLKSLDELLTKSFHEYCLW